MSPKANVPPLFIPITASGPPGSRRASQRLSSWIAGQVGRRRLASASASPKWSLCPWVTSRRSHAVTAAAAFGLFGLPNHGSMRIVFPPGVLTSTQACPYQVIVVAASRPIFSLPVRGPRRAPAGPGSEAAGGVCARLPGRARGVLLSGGFCSPDPDPRTRPLALARTRPRPPADYTPPDARRADRPEPSLSLIHISEPTRLG